MRRVLKQGIAVVIAAAMVISLAPAGSADAAKSKLSKVKLSKTKASVTVGKTVKISVKKGTKKAKVTWSTSKKKVAKITKKKAKGNSAYAKIKGVKKGKAKITATYKLGNKKKKLVCNVTVKKASNVQTSKAPAQASKAPTQTSKAPAASPTATTQVSAVPSATAAVTSPTPAASKTPRPSPTPTNAPKNGALSAYEIATGGAITVDGQSTKGEAWKDSMDQDLLANVNSVRGTTTVKAATTRLMWEKDAFYILTKVTKENVGTSDSVNIYFDQDAAATGDYAANTNAINISVPVSGAAVAVSNGSAYTWEAKATSTSEGYEVEAKINLKDAISVSSGSVSYEVQINDGTAATINYFDSVYKMAPPTVSGGAWELKDEGIQVGKDTSLFGKVTLLAPMAQATSALYTGNGAAILAAAAISDEYEDPESTIIKSKTMTFVDTSFWTDVYAEASSPSIVFTNANIPDYKGNAEKVTLEANNRDSAQGYILWDKEYLYVLFDINDPDIAPASESHFDTDSTEFFLDEDYSRPTSYGSGDEVQLRVDAINNAFSANDAGTGPYEVVAHATNIKKDSEGKSVGYQVEYIIKFVSQHKTGDIMGMDLQINDCFTVPGEPTTDEETGEEVPGVATADRAGTLTAYDTENRAYENPSCFGRVELVGDDDPTPATETPATAEP